MPSVLGQVGQNVANNLFEIGQSAVKAAAGAAVDIASGSVEQLTGSPTGSTAVPMVNKQADESQTKTNVSKEAANRRFQEVKNELATYIQRRKELEKKIAEEKMVQNEKKEREKFVEKKEHESWVSKVINRSQTNTEKGRLQE